MKIVLKENQPFLGKINKAKHRENRGRMSGRRSPTGGKSSSGGKTSPGGQSKSPSGGKAGTQDAKQLAKTKMGGNARRRKKEESKEVELTEEQKAAKKEADRKKFIQNYCTRLDFTMKDGSTHSKLLEAVRMETYTELQRALARVTPRSLQIFMCLSTTGDVLTPENFKEAEAYRIKEMPNAKIEAVAKSKFKPKLDPRWEFYDYHGGAPEGWVDRIEVEKQKKKRAAQAAKEREAQDRAAEKMMERLTGGDSDSSDGGFDDL